MLDLARFRGYKVNLRLGCCPFMEPHRILVGERHEDKCPEVLGPVTKVCKIPGSL